MYGLMHHLIIIIILIIVFLHHLSRVTLGLLFLYHCKKIQVDLGKDPGNTYLQACFEHIQNMYKRYMICWWALESGTVNRIYYVLSVVKCIGFDQCLSFKG